jgi:putative flippase GtrA
MKIIKLKTTLSEIELRKVIRFQAIAWLGSLVNLGVLWLMHGKLKVPLMLAGVIAIEIAIIHNFTWNYFVTWKNRVLHSLPDFLSLALKYNIVTASIDFTVNLGILWSLTHYLKINYLIADLAGQLVGPIFKFLANEFLIFPLKDYTKPPC